MIEGIFLGIPDEQHASILEGMLADDGAPMPPFEQEQFAATIDDFTFSNETWAKIFETVGHLLRLVRTPVH